jgi:hypothetical protein
MSDQQIERHAKKWQQIIWIGVAISLGVGFLLLIYFVSSTLASLADIIVAFSSKAVDDHFNDKAVFLFSSVSLVNLTLLRLLAILTGTGVIFGGLAVSFFTHAEANKLLISTGNTSQTSPKGALATHSPGIVAVVVGAIIIISALYSKSEFNYDLGSTQQHVSKVDYKESAGQSDESKDDFPAPYLPSNHKTETKPK